MIGRIQPGDVVIRRRRLLKTQGTVLRFDGKDEHGASRAWVKWNHPDTLPNPSLEVVDGLELVRRGDAALEASPTEDTPPESRPLAL